MRFTLLMLALMAPGLAWAALDPASVVALMNRERVSAGLPALRIDAQLTAAAQEKAASAAASGALVHSASAPGTPWPVLARSGYAYSIAGENLAEGFETAGEMVADWMASPTHRRNILTAGYVDTGVAVVTSNGTSYAVAYFAAPPQSQGEEEQRAALLRQLIALYAELIRLVRLQAS